VAACIIFVSVCVQCAEREKAAGRKRQPLECVTVEGGNAHQQHTTNLTGQTAPVLVLFAHNLTGLG